MSSTAEKLIHHSQLPGLPDGYIYTEDFAPTDQWSTFMRRICAVLYTSQPELFSGRDWLELGIGDGRNIASLWEIGARPNRIIGVDIVPSKIEMAKNNLISQYNISPNQLELHHADAVSYLKGVDRTHPFTGLGIMCLPQAPGVGTPADVYKTDTTSPLAKWDKYGLYLNAATLSQLSEVATDDFRLIMILSGRVPRNIREQMIDDTGWHIKRRFLTSHPIRQDPDTSVDYVKRYDDGKRFYEKNEKGEFAHISAEVAAAQVNTFKKMIKDGIIDIDTAKKYLNVHHHLRIYLLEKKLKLAPVSVNIFNG